ncbi:MAG: N-acetylmuramoyl-L-alanine amidase [Acidimicrobiales bacterium]
MTRRPCPFARFGAVAFKAAVAGLLMAGCAAPAARASHSRSRTQSPPVSVPTSTTPSTVAPSTVAPTTPSTVAPVRITAPAGQPLAGVVIGIDPGHNGLNYTDPNYLNQQVWNGREEEDCDTTGTETDTGYTESQFNFDVAQFLTADLEALGARVVLTRSTNSGVGPCVDKRAQILDAAQAAVAIDIHADGGPSGGRGFAILEPVADGPNDAVISYSGTFGRDVRTSFLSTGMPVSTYDGTDGIAYRDDLAGLNLTTVPKVLIECGNMKNATDAAMLVTTSFQKSAAAALAQAITAFVR